MVTVPALHRHVWPLLRDRWARLPGRVRLRRNSSPNLRTRVCAERRAASGARDSLLASFRSGTLSRGYVPGRRCRRCTRTLASTGELPRNAPFGHSMLSTFGRREYRSASSWVTWAASLIDSSMSSVHHGQLRLCRAPKEPRSRAEIRGLLRTRRPHCASPCALGPAEPPRMRASSPLSRPPPH